MIEIITSFLMAQMQYIEQFGYLIVFSVALAETLLGVGMIIPSSTILLFLGGYSATTGNLVFLNLVFLAALGAILGDNINYYLGKRFGKKWTKTGIWIVKPSHFNIGQKYFIKHGGKSVLFGRFLPMVKEITPFIAGMMKMNRFEFFIFNVLGAIGWAFEFLGLGFIFSGSIILAKVWLSRIAFLVFLILIFFFLLALIQWGIKKYGEFFLQSIKEAILSIKNFYLNKPKVQKWLLKHHKIVLFWQERISKKSFFGFYLTIFSLFFFYFLFTFIGLVQDLLLNNMIIQIDERLANLFNLFHHKILISLFLWITLLGKAKIVIVFTGITSVILFLIKQKKDILPLFISVLGASGFAFITKLFFHRERPNLAIYLEHSYSFPSGHATIAVAFYGFLAWLFIKNIKNWKSKVNIIIITISIIFAIAFSRLYLVVHYLSDVLGGILVGAMALTFAMAVSKYLEMKDQNFKSTSKISSKGLLSPVIIILLLSGLSFYIFTGLNYQKTLVIKTQTPIKMQTINNISELFDNNHLKFTETITGRATEPINFIFIAEQSADIEKVFTTANWSKSDDLSIKTGVKMLDNLLGGNEYQTAPATPLFWNGEIQNFTFQKLINQKSIKVRHHIRIWETPFYLNNKKIFLGCAVFDEGMKWGITHKISADIDNEREVVFLNLKNIKGVNHFEEVQLTKPYQGLNFSGDKFITDGKAYIIEF